MRFCGCGKFKTKYRQNLRRHIKQKHGGIAPKGSDIRRKGRKCKNSE